MTQTALAEQPAPQTAGQPIQRRSLVMRMAERFNVEPARLVPTLKATAFKTEKPVSDEQLFALLVVANEYNLNPFTREIFAFLDKHTGAIIPIVSVDGWCRIINERAELDGIEFEHLLDEQLGEGCRCTIYRKDRSRPTSVVEWLRECKRNTGPWSTHPQRMLRHKALIQCARIAFGFAGLFDEDEGQRIVAVQTVPADEVRPASRLRDALAAPVTTPPLAEPEAAPVPPAEVEQGLTQDCDAYVDEINSATSPDKGNEVRDRSRLDPNLTAADHMRITEAFERKWVPNHG